jgi:microcystin-dependent protein
MSEAYLGEIRIMGFNFNPVGWAYCDGAILSIAQNTALFSLLGTTYGGNGTTTFALPDLRGRVPLQQNGTYSLGTIDGFESHTLTLSEVPSHSHYPIASTMIANSQTAANNVWATTSVSSYHTSLDSTTMKIGALSVSGGDQAHSNMQPFLVLNFCIALTGIFPPRS